MAIIKLPKDEPANLRRGCAICELLQPLDKLTVGMRDRNNSQLYACDEHIKEGRHFIHGWATHVAALTSTPRYYVPFTKGSGPYIELRQVDGLRPSLSWDLAHHLLARLLPGKVLVLTDKPSVSLSAIRKQWMPLVRSVRRERSATLKPGLVHDLGLLLHHMERLHMTIKEPQAAPDRHVFLLTPDEGRIVPQDCHTLYVTAPLDDSAFEILVAKVPSHALIVRYQIAS